MATGQHWNVPTGPQGAWAGGRGGREEGETHPFRQSFYDFLAEPVFFPYTYIYIYYAHTRLLKSLCIFLPT